VNIRRKLALFGVAVGLAAGMSMVSAPVVAAPTYCQQQAWWFCDPSYTRGTTEWWACVDNYIANCVYNGCIENGSNQCVANRMPKALPLQKLKKLQKAA